MTPSTIKHDIISCKTSNNVKWLTGWSIVSFGHRIPPHGPKRTCLHIGHLLPPPLSLCRLTNRSTSSMWHIVSFSTSDHSSMALSSSTSRLHHRHSAPPISSIRSSFNFLGSHRRKRDWARMWEESDDKGTRVVHVINVIEECMR
jgi:hypothetical protein